MKPQSNDPTPFDPPYFTFLDGEDGRRVVETMADGTTRTVKREGSFPMGVQPSTPSTPGVKSATAGVAPPKSDPATGNKGAALILEVPFAQKDKAKGIGAKWDADKKKWYVPHGVDIRLFEAWWPASLKEN